MSASGDRAWHERFALSGLPRALTVARKASLIGPDDTSIVFHDLDLLHARLDALRAAFPASALHALAIKANPYVKILELVVERGFGLEAASMEEVEIARAAGCRDTDIVFDSPAKTDRELLVALQRGHRVNLDSFEEVDRVAAFVAAGSVGLPLRSSVGLRVNPRVGAGRIAATSVTVRSSKFGVSIDDDRARVVDAFVRHAWLDTIHVHAGSQGTPVPMLVESVVRALELRREIEAKSGPGRVRTLDLGGGLPATYASDAPAPTLAEYVEQLRARAGDAFDDGLQLVTEFGRSVHAGCAVALTRIETVKDVGGRPTLVVHVGADMFLRRVYNPDDWDHEMAVLDPSGAQKPVDASCVPADVVGPLCFAGDVLARGRALASSAAGDWLVVRDVGAYTLSMWSRHCSRAMPVLLGVSGEGASVRVLRPRESVDDIVRLWGGTR